MKSRNLFGAAATALSVIALAAVVHAQSAGELPAEGAATVQPEPGAFDRPRTRAARGSASAIDVPSVLVTLVEQVSVPARESGVLAVVAVEEGLLVEEGDLLARVDDAEAQLDKRKAELELQIARRKSTNDVKVRFAQKAAEVAAAEYKRSLESRRLFGGSVSDSDLDRDRLTAEKARLDIEQAEFDFSVEALQAQLNENALAVAVRGVERRQILSPIAGVVVEVSRRRGEWVQPGEQVFRILRIDRLRAEGFLSASEVQGDLTGRRAVLRIDLPGRPGTEFEGKVTFVSPEIDPVNGQMSFWAEIENRDRLLRPGLKAALTIDAPAATAAR